MKGREPLAGKVWSATSLAPDKTTFHPSFLRALRLLRAAGSPEKASCPALRL